MRFIATVAAFIVAACTFAQSNPQGTFWLGTSLMYETPWEAGRPYTFGIGFAPVVVDRPGDNDIRVGIAGELNYYNDGQPRGMALVGRVGLVNDGLFFAPGVYYVSRPANPRDISFRTGVLVPFGNIGDFDILPWVFELGVGFRF